MLLVTLLIILTTFKANSGGTEDASKERNLLAIYTLEIDPVCSPDMIHFNFTYSVAAAVRYVRSLMPNNSETFFHAILSHLWSPGCSMQEASRASTLYEILQDLQKNASNYPGFSVLLGPPLASDCDMVNEWVNLGNPIETQRAQLYQISYYCPVLSSTSFFVNHLADSSCDSLTPPIAAVSVVVQHKTLLQGIFVQLASNGWKRIALLYDIHTTFFDIPEMLDSILSTLHLSQNGNNVLELLTSVGITSTTNFTSLLEPLEDHLDVALILARAGMALNFVVGVQNLTRIQQGRIALLHVDPMNMLTYDVLRGWGAQLCHVGPTSAAGRSLIIATALPKGTRFNEESVPYKERISLSVASGAALAMRLVQIHLQEGDGNITPSSSLFQPLRTFPHIQVPTLPYITFHYQINGDDVSQGIFDLLLFSLKSNVTEVADPGAHAERYADIFNLIYVINHPLMLPQPRGVMNWPGDGEGPQRTCGLFVPCGLEQVRIILLINLLGMLNAGLIYLAIVLVYRRIVRKTKRFNALKLVFVESDFVFKANDGNPLVKRRHDGVQVYIKELALSRILLRSRLIEHLAGLREMRHENVNAFVGCCVTPDSFSLVFQYCHRESLQDVINSKGIIFDWEFKLSLMTDFVRYIHSTSLKAHGRLKSTNCLVSCRYGLKITDFGIPKIYNLLLRDERATFVGTKPGDVYAFGIIMHEVFYQTKPYGPEDMPVEEILERVMCEENPPFRPQFLGVGVPPTYRDIIERAWSDNPRMRPTFKGLNEEIQRLTSGKKTNIVEHMFKMMEDYSSRLEEEVKARTDELDREKRKKELLICRLLPPGVEGGCAVAPETYDEVSIYISDIVGFTTISAMSTPLQVVDLLNDLYTLFDKTIAHYDVYKVGSIGDASVHILAQVRPPTHHIRLLAQVETIGDAYMVTSGLPVRNGRRHAAEVATMALDLLSACGTFTIKHLPQVPLRLRIGLHSGPCVAGVVGLTRPRYCLFGDTVNRALKMESSGAVFRIHISREMKEILDEIGGYHVDYRGLVEFGGGAETKGYWLTGSDNFHKPLPQPPPLTM
ncbi:Retinal guanylyl cyclase 2 [Taenia solium]|eukprot:TsM_000180000 transcript=TsM_000180000 gene=TsM_000180000